MYYIKLSTAHQFWRPKELLHAALFVTVVYNQHVCLRILVQHPMEVLSSSVSNNVEAHITAAWGTTYLILIQVTSRVLTFISNQLLLRYLSPSIFGLATQLELYSSSVLSFSRESIRIATQREKGHSAREDSNRTTRECSQAVVNVSYLAVVLGCPLVYVLGCAYIRVNASNAPNSHLLQESVVIVALATILELFSEPCFAVIQQRMLFRRRAAIETSSALVKAVFSYVAAMWMQSRGTPPGVLPFALGQLGFATTVLCGYLISAFPLSVESGFSLLPRSLNPSGSSASGYLRPLIPFPLLSRSVNVYMQSVAKHLLTKGDTIVLAAWATLEQQGQYAIASNYGGLVTRVLFQPLEEATRSFLGRLLGSHERNAPKPENLDMAKFYLCGILRAYGIITVFTCAFGPFIVPQILDFVMGSQWVSLEMHGILSTYCYYIPFLAFNGITEAFVSSVASNSELRKQTMWMAAFSAAFAAGIYFFIGICQLDARGLVMANITNMALRIVWSYRFIQRYFRRHGHSFTIKDISPSGGTIVAGIIMYGSITVVQPPDILNMHSIADVFGIVLGFGILVLYFERHYLRRQIFSLVLNRSRKKVES
ncbi:hypothetical protein VTO42DRAFT_370 [Malbranchea cinnamomea]